MMKSKLTNHTWLYACLFLLFIFPPLGIGSLAIFGLYYFSFQMKWEKFNRFTVTHLFFGALLVASIGSAIHFQDWRLLLLIVLVASYFGLYSYAMTAMTKQRLTIVRNVFLAGSVYCIIAQWLAPLYAKVPYLPWLTGTFLMAGDSPSSGGRLVGSTYNPNFTAFLLMVSISLLISVLYNAWQEKRRLLFWPWPLMMTFTYGIYWTGSRAAIATLLVIILLSIIRLFRTLGFTVALILFSAMPLWIPLLPRMQKYESSVLVRQTVWKESYDVWQQSFLFGVSPFRFTEMTAAMPVPVSHAHNALLAMFAEYGIIGGAAFICLLLSIVAKLITLRYRQKNELLYQYFYFLFPTMLLLSLLDHPLFSPQLHLLMLFFFATWDKYTANLAPKYVTWPQVKVWLTEPKRWLSLFAPFKRKKSSE